MDVTTNASTRSATTWARTTSSTSLHHRTGVLEAGEDVVFVVVHADHRREAFQTVEDRIDRLKDEVPL